MQSVRAMARMLHAGFLRYRAKLMIQMETPA
jgi:hypothetical protein